MVIYSVVRFNATNGQTLIDTDATCCLSDCLIVCLFVWVCGCVGVGVWVCGCVGVWLWLCGCVVVWLCGCVVVFALSRFGQQWHVCIGFYPYA